VLVTLWVATALLYPVLRRVTGWFVDTVVLSRPDYRSLRAVVASRVQTHEDIGALLTEVCELLAPAVSSRTVFWRELRGRADDHLVGSVVVAGARVRAFLQGETVSGSAEADADKPPRSIAAIVIVPVSEPPRYAISIAELTGGRRLLSDDVGTLEAIAAVLARRIDVIRITRERFQRELREQEMMKLATEAELRALRAQLNPHFLFNALTTIGHLIQTAPTRALETLMQLTALLRGVLRSEGEYTTLGRELEVIESYLDIEQARFEQRLRVHIDVPASLRTIQVPPLLLQPIVENAVKHGIAACQLGGEVRVRARLEGTGPAARYLSLVVQDTGIGATEAALQRGRQAGVGLRNIERRLACQYGVTASLSIRTVPDEGTTVTIQLPVATNVAVEAEPVGR
jgi:LytS/YehU family sensor histidine kinase